MKRLLLSASAVALLALPAIASAQGYDNQRDHRDNRSAPARSAPAYRPASRQANPGAYRNNAPAQRSYAPARPNYTLGRGNQNYGPQGGPGRSPVYRASPNQPFQRPANTQAWRNLPQGQLGRGRVQQGGGVQGWNRGGENRGGEGWNRGGQNWNRNGQAWNRGGEGWNRGNGWWRGREGFEGYEGRRDGEWFAPGWGYYRPDPYYANYSWGVGVLVPFGLRSYYVEDPYAYGLDAAPYGYRWIFLDNQLVLIDVRTGVIVQVAGQY